MNRSQNRKARRAHLQECRPPVEHTVDMLERAINEGGFEALRFADGQPARLVVFPPVTHVDPR